MNRYVIVCLFKNEVKEFHSKLVGEVCNKFNVRPQKLGAHFTIKAPFEIEDISNIEDLTFSFCRKISSEKIILKGYGHFRDNVIFMDVKPSLEARLINDRYIEELKKINNLTWQNNELKNKNYHCTIVSRRISTKFIGIWEYVSKQDYCFETKFDNITIMRWNDNGWKIYREFDL
ncbi:2'-5' RNA ligase family protein [Clostridium sediminicola]|uniref:2'-5' RNA ligase family protein n=1 Tax=Clostridium sediminicola TaxID=3114879 RepID=UPI0031F1ED9A